ncbi:esterase-like activity of phytase family protein [Streptomyces angustmyceticus]
MRRYDRHGRLLGQLPVPENLKAYKIANRTFEGLTVDGRTLDASTEGWSTKDGTDTRRFQTWQRGHRGPYRVNSQFAYMGDTGYHRRAVWLREEARLAGGDWREARAASHATRAAINAWWSSPPPARHGDVRRPETGPNPRVEYCGPCEPHERCPRGRHRVPGGIVIVLP